MDNREEKLSGYIDSLNKEKKPIEHGNEIESLEMNELFKTVRQIRSLREPSLPEDDYSKRLASNINSHLLKKENSRKSGKRWLLGAAVAASLALIITVSTVGPLGKPRMVYAMEQAFKTVKAYHGVLEVVETNAEGKSTVQSKAEVWADKEGRYYVKGLEGAQRGLITVNNGQKKWQVQPDQREVEVFLSSPDPYSFTLEIGREIEDAKNALRTKIIGNDRVAGREASIMEVTPNGGTPYRLWIDKETNMPLQRETSMEYGLKYRVRYVDINFTEKVPGELLTYSIPKGYKEIRENTEQILGNLEESKGILGFEPTVVKNLPNSFTRGRIAVIDERTSKIEYTSMDGKRISVLQKKSSEEFKPSPMAVLGKVDNNTAEVQSPVESEGGVLQGGAYAGLSGISSVRWQQDGFEYAVVGNASLDELGLFIKALTNSTIELSPEQTIGKPKVEVPVDLKAEEGDQKNADAGHSPWKLDPAFVAQVFVSLKISPQGIQGEYPIDYKEFKVIENTGIEAVVEVGGNKTPIRKVYLKRLIRQDNTGIWTVVGYDPAK